MYRLTANLEWMFTEAGDDPAARVDAAAAHGFDAVEIWEWRNKDVLALQAALDENDVSLLSLIVDPKLDLTDRANHRQYLKGVEESVPVAQQLGSPYLVVVAGDEQPGVPRADQHAAVGEALTAAADVVAGSGVTLLLENLNSKVDHVGTYLDRTAEALQLIREVDRPELRMLFDAYHALVMGEDIETELAGSIDLVGHVQIADVPGRHEPGTGTIDWRAQFEALDRLGYTGAVGLEYSPTTPTAESLRTIEAIRDELQQRTVR